MIMWGSEAKGQLHIVEPLPICCCSGALHGYKVLACSSCRDYVAEPPLIWDEYTWHKLQAGFPMPQRYPCSLTRALGYQQWILAVRTANPSG